MTTPLWNFPILTMLRGFRQGAAPPEPETPSTEEGMDVEVAPPVTNEVAANVVPTFQGEEVVNRVTSAAGVEFEVVFDPSKNDVFPYGVRCPSSPFFDKLNQFRTQQDAEWYVKEVVHGSSTEAAAASSGNAALPETPVDTGFNAHEGEYGAGTGMVGRGGTGRYI